MRARVRSLSFVVVSALWIAFAGCSKEEAAAPALSAALNKSRVSFEEIPPGTTLRKTVLVNNNGAEPFFIDPVGVSGATGDAIFRGLRTGTASLELQPGQSAEVVVMMEAGQTIGRSAATLTIGLKPRSSPAPDPLRVELDVSVVSSLSCGSCDAKPADRCLTPNDLSSFASAAPCSNGSCGYRQTVISCPAGCDYVTLACKPLACRKEGPVKLSESADVGALSVDAIGWANDALWMDGSSSPAAGRSALVLANGSVVDPGVTNLSFGTLTPRRLSTAAAPEREYGQLVAFSADVDGKEQLHVMRYGRVLETQPAPVQLTTEGGAITHPVAAGGDDHRAEYGVIWQDARASAPGLYFARIDATTGERLGSEVLVSDAGATLVGRPAVIWVPIPTTAWVVVWAEERDGGGSELYSRRISLSGVAVGPAVQLTDSDAAATLPVLEVLTDGLRMTWAESASGASSIATREMTAWGAPRTERSLVRDVGSSSIVDLRVSATGARRGLAWLVSDADANAAGVWAMISQANGVMSEPRRLSAAVEGADLFLAPSTDEFALFWTAKLNGATTRSAMFQRLCELPPSDD